MFHVAFMRVKKVNIHVDYNKVSIFVTNCRLESVYMTKLHLYAMQWMPMINGACFSMSFIITLVFKLWNIITPFAPKQTNLNVKSPSNMCKERTIYGQVLTMNGNFIEI
jgi:hypothetical protein